MEAGASVAQASAVVIAGSEAVARTQQPDAETAPAPEPTLAPTQHEEDEPDTADGEVRARVLALGRGGSSTEQPLEPITEEEEEDGEGQSATEEENEEEGDGATASPKGTNGVADDHVTTTPEDHVNTGRAALARLASGSVPTVTNRGWFPKGRGLEEDSVAKAAGTSGIVIVCTPEFWQALGYDGDTNRAGARLKLLVKMAEGRTFHKQAFPKEAKLAGRWTFHVVPSMRALSEQAEKTTVEELEGVLNMQAKQTVLRKINGLEVCPTCDTPLAEDELTLVHVYRCAKGGQRAHAPTGPAAHSSVCANGGRSCAHTK